VWDIQNHNANTCHRNLRKYRRNDFEVMSVSNPKSSYFQNISYTSPPTAKTHLTEGFVVCRLMTDHEQTLKIISKYFEMILNIGK